MIKVPKPNTKDPLKHPKEKPEREEPKPGSEHQGKPEDDAMAREDRS